MAVFKGVTGSVEVDTVVLAVTAWTLDYTINLAETTEVGDSDKTSVPTTGSGSGSLTFNLKDVEATQNQILSQFTASGTRVAVALELIADTGDQFDCNANLTGISTSISPEGIYAVTCNFEPTGGISAIPVAAA